MKILIISNLYKPFAHGGAEAVAEIMADELLVEGHEIVVLSTRPYFSTVGNLVGYKTVYWPAIYYNLSKMPIFLRIFWHFFDALNFISFFRLKSFLKQENFDLVVTHNLKGIGYLIPLAVKQQKTKHIHVLHDVQLFYPSGLMYYGQEKNINSLPFRIYTSLCVWLFSSPTKIISPSKWLADMHLKRGFFAKSKISILSNPIVFSGNNNVKQINRKFRFLFAGQTEPHKGVVDLVESFKMMPNNKDCELIIAGAGSQLEQLKLISKDYPNIVFLGWMKIPDLRNKMKEVDCLVVPSLCYENSPTVISEAAANGLPTLASNIGGIGELIKIFSGYLFEPGNKTQLTQMMMQILNDKSILLKNGEQAKDMAQKMSIKNYLRDLLDFF